MNKNFIRNKLRLFTMISIVLFALISFSFSYKYSSNCVFADVELQDEYVVGNILEFPNCELEIDGTVYQAETILHYPNGSAKKCTSERFSEAGMYSLEYRKVVSNKLYNKIFQFRVVDEICSVNSSSSVKYKTDDSQYNTGISGLWVDLSNGGTFKYNKVVDLSVLDEKEPAISLFLLPKTQGERDLTDLIVTFTDAHDSSNSVVVQFNCVHWQSRQSTSKWQDESTMIFAGTSMAELYGYRYAAETGGSYEKGDTWYRYGYETLFSFNAKGAKPVGQEFLTISFDLDKGYVLGPDNGKASGRIGMEEPLLVADLKDDVVYSSAWKGFTTGEVYISIKGAGYINSSAEFMINKIGKEDLSQKYFSSNTKPTISVDMEGYNDKNVPVAQVGVPYPLFKAVGSDCFTKEYKLKPRVFYQYGYDTCWEMNVENDTFVPDKLGVYTVVYSVIDGYGVTAEKSFNVLALNNVSNITIDDSDVIKNSKTGVEVSVGDAIVSGGSGNIDLDISVKLGSENILVKDNKIKPVVSGEYLVEITATDYIGNTVKKSYILNVVANDELMIESDVCLPKYFIEGKKYILPDLVVYDYTSGSTVKEILSKIEITDKDGTIDLGDDREYTVKGKNGVVKVRYYAVSDGKNISLPVVEIPVINVLSNSEIDIKNYFLTSDTVDSSTSKDGVSFSCKEEGSFEFIKPIVVDKFLAKVQISKTKNNFELLELYITDSVNTNENIKITFERLSSGNIKVLINDKKVTGSISTTFTNGIIATIEYSQGRLKINGTEIMVSVRTYANGQNFNGFSSGKVYFSAYIGNVSNESVVTISQINNQPISSSVAYDGIMPEVSLVENYSLVSDVGNVIELSDIYADDVLDTFLVKNVTVTDPNGQKVVSLESVILDKAEIKQYKIKLDCFGVYEILYTVTDTEGNKLKYNIAITVVDSVKPEIKLNGDVTTEAIVGDKIILPSAEVFDNYSDKISSVTFVVMPNYLKKVYSEDMVYDKQGTYTINYIAYDEAGNMAMLSYKVVVADKGE